MANRVRDLVRGALGGGARTVSITYDRRDKPPWTAELQVNGKTKHLRSGDTMEHALMRLSEAAR